MIDASTSVSISFERENVNRGVNKITFDLLRKSAEMELFHIIFLQYCERLFDIMGFQHNDF